MQRFEELDECSRFGRTQVFSVGGHVTAALDYLADELILRELDGDSIQLWSALSARPAQRMAVVALFRLKYERSLSLQGRTPLQVLRWNRFAALRVHHRTPWSIPGQVRESSQRDGHEQDCENRNGPALPALLAFA